MERVDAIVAGAGFSGQWTASSLAQAGLSVLMLGHRPAEKSLFVQGAVLHRHNLLSALANQPGALYSINKHVMDYPDQYTQLDAGTGANLLHPEKQYYAIDHQALLDLKPGLKTFAHWPTTIQRVYPNKGGLVVVTHNGQKVAGDLLVDSSGSASQVSRNLIYSNSGTHLPLVEDDPIVLWCWGHRMEADVKDINTLYSIGSAGAGAGSWLLPWGNEMVDIVASGFSRLSKLAQVPQKSFYERLLKYCLERDYLGNIGGNVQSIRGIIRMQPILKRSTDIPNVFITGDASGMGSPAYGEVIPAILNNTPILTKVIQEGKTARDFHSLWRHHVPTFPYDLEQAVLLRKAEPRGKHFYYQLDRSGGAGSNIPLYQVLTKYLSPEEQQHLLLTRQIPLDKLWMHLGGLVTHPGFTQYSLDVTWRYCKIQLNNLMDILP